jgi:hypothetical protein
MDLQEVTDDWLADRRKRLHHIVSVLNKKAKTVGAEIDDLELEFNRRFAERNSTGTQTDKWFITQQIDDHYPEMQDRDEFYSYMIATRKTHLMQKRLSVTAIREELDLLIQEKQHWLDELEENNWDAKTCTRCLTHILERRIDEQAHTNDEVSILQQEHDHRLSVLRAVGNWKTVTTNVLNDFYRIPGVVLREKITLSQRKR